ncbi:heparin lyase I family protein [Puniceicoccus vermicola]|uniref:Heparin lyase I family protein n=1 Tax=Puniceicoccus vermicola TaxID=388746 RepID=A0A7X1E5J6_9BACT|nr:heparin lyase I family protein [Puniceicoccus vermicola]MBC2603725.1 heparin lyase I family protein [Puniceicoccus vermicola]
MSKSTLGYWTDVNDSKEHKLQNLMMKNRTPFIAALGIITLALPVANYAQTASEDFEDGSFSPFNVEVLEGNVSEIVEPTDFPARSGSKVHRIVWKEENYNGRRSGRSVEGSSGFHLPRITSEGWFGFSLYAPADFPTPGKNIVLGQIHAWDHSLPKTNITITVHLEDNGALMLEGAYGVGDGRKEVTVYTTLAPELTKETWHDFILYCKFSNNNTGILRAWMDGAPESEPTVEYTDIKLGNGGWTTSEEMTAGAYIKWGPYCWDYRNYDEGETREIFYDDIAYIVGNPEDAFSLVQPTGYGTQSTSPEEPPAVVLEETFDAMPTNKRPEGWHVHAERQTNVAIREIAGDPGQCMQFWDENPEGYAEAWKSFLPQSQPITARWSFKENGILKGHRMQLLSGNTTAVELETDGKGNLIFIDSEGTPQIVGPIQKNTWHEVRVDLRPEAQTADIFLDGTPALSDVSTTHPVNFVDRILFGSSETPAKWHLYVNDVSVRRTEQP